MIDHIHSRADLIAALQFVPRREFLSDRDGARANQPVLEIKFSRVEIDRIESSERFVRENIDSEDLQIFTGKIGQRDQTANERGRSGDPRSGRGLREDRLGQTPCWRSNLQFRLAGHHVDRGGKRAIRTVIGELGRKENCNAKPDAQNIQSGQQRMAAQVTNDVPAKNAKILSFHLEGRATDEGCLICRLGVR